MSNVMVGFVSVYLQSKLQCNTVRALGRLVTSISDSSTSSAHSTYSHQTSVRLQKASVESRRSLPEFRASFFIQMKTTAQCE